MYYWHWMKNLVARSQTTSFPTRADPEVAPWISNIPTSLATPGNATAKIRRSCAIRHVDAGSCNGCESELSLLVSPAYDFTRYGFSYTPSPKHADMLVVTGVITEAMIPVLQQVYRQMGEPKLVIAVGECALTGHVFRNASGVVGSLAGILPVAVKVAGCPPTPPDILRALFLALEGVDPMTRYSGGNPQ